MAKAKKTSAGVSVPPVFKKADTSNKTGGTVYQVTKEIRLSLSGKYGLLGTEHTLRERNDGIFTVYKGEDKTFISVGAQIINQFKDSLTLNK